MHASASFRFLSLSKEQAEELKSLIPKTDIGEHYETGNQVGSIELADDSNNDIIETFRNRHLLKPTDCDIFISIASEKRDEIWRAPKVVNNLINVVNCPILFSYTC